MIPKERLIKEIEIPEGIEVNIDKEFTVKGAQGEVKRKLVHPTVKITKKENKIIIEPKQTTKREKRTINTFWAHINNMIKGVQEPFVYKVKVASSHFPMTVNVEGDKIIIKNFLGEKVPRKAKIAEGSTAKVEGDIIVITSPNKEAAGQTAGSLEQATRITNRDRRIFQDGCWIMEKGK